MHTGELYYPNEESIFDEQLKKLDLLYEFNSTRPTEQKKRQALMKEMFAEVGENCYLEPPFHANWGGAHMYLGDSRRLRESLPRREGDKRTRPRVLLQRQTNHERDF